MLHPLTISVPKPCHESWTAMTPAAQGRHCAACNTVVTDFTRMSDAEVMLYLGQPKGATCGRFRPDQLQRPLRPTAAATGAWRQWLAAAAAVLGVGAAAAPVAQAQQPAPTEQHVITMGLVAVPSRIVPLPQWAPTTVVRGRVTAGNQALPGVTVLLEGTTLGVATADDGTFELPIPVPAAGRQLVFSSIGFLTQRHVIGTDAAPALVVELVPDGRELGGLIVTGYAGRKPWPWHPRVLWHRLTRPFRRH